MFKPAEKSFYAFLFLWVVIVGCSLVNLLHRPGLPYTFFEEDHRLFLFKQGKIFPVTTIDGIPVNNKSIALMIIETKKIGQPVTIETSDHQRLHFKRVKVNNPQDVLINLLPGLFFLLVALWIRRSKADAPESYFIWAGYLFGLIIAISWDGMGHAVCGPPALIVFYLAYPLAFAVFLIYSFYFPQPALREPILKRFKAAILSLALLVGVALGIAGFWRYAHPEQYVYQFYYQFYRIFRLFTLLLILLSFLNMFLNFKRTREAVARLRFYWVAGGILLGSFPFIFLWSIPQALALQPLIPEWVSDLFLIIVPLSVAVAILKYRLFDIEVVLSRSVTYLVTLSLIITVYVLVVGSLSFLLSRNVSFQSPYLSAVAAVVVALTFNPLLGRVRRFVDQKLFHIRYNQFRVLQQFLDELAQCSDIQRLGRLLEHNLQRILPLTRNTFLPCNQFQIQQPLKKDQGPVRLLVNENHLAYFEILTDAIPTKLADELFLVVEIDSDWCWALGRKVAGTRFWHEDMELIKEMARAVQVAIEKIRFWQRALKESAEKEAANKLSAWKSLMVSEVAHNFNGPLNSLLWKIETWDAQRFEQQKNELKQQIDRLQNMVRSLLNLAALESGRMEVHLQTLNVKQVIQKVRDSLQWQINEKQMTLRLSVPDQMHIRADAVLAEGIFQNVLENALKYAPAGSTIEVASEPFAEEERPMARITICDQGPGISQDELESVFTPFAGKSAKRGLHLGLYMTRQFARAIGGDVAIHARRQGQGTCVAIVLPLMRQQQD